MSLTLKQKWCYSFSLKYKIDWCQTVLEKILNFTNFLKISVTDQNYVCRIIGMTDACIWTSRIWCCRHGFIFQWNVISVVYADITLSRNLFIFKSWFLLWISAHLVGVDRPFFSILLTATGEDKTTLGIIYCYTQDHWVFFLLINHCINLALWTFRASFNISSNDFFIETFIRKEIIDKKIPKTKIDTKITHTSTLDRQHST